jgi:uncharacterized protein involved in outer membrane biogenesis
MTYGRRIALGITVAIVLAAVAAALALPRLVDPDRLKRIAREKAQALWGRELSIGEVSLDLWPLPTLHAGQVGLANAPWAKSKQLLYAESVDARLELLPLVVGKVRLKSLDLDGVRVNLETRADGLKSWDLVAPGAKKPPKAGSLDDSDFMNLMSLGIRNADLTQRSKSGVTVFHVDEANATADSGLRDVQFEASVTRNRKPLTLKGRFADLSRLGVPGATTEAHIDFDWGKTHLALAGRLPIDAAFNGYALTADLKAESLHDAFAFLGDSRLPTAPVVAHMVARESEGRTEVSEMTATFGKHSFTGAASFTRTGAKTSVNGRLETARLDWEKALTELGYPPLAPLPPEELFHDNELAWPLLVGLDGTEGAFDLKLGSFVMRNGIEMRNVKARAAWSGDKLNVSPFAVETLGGTATGSLALEGRKKAVRVNFEGTNLLLERWFRERGSKIPFTGGPMKVKAVLATSGDSMKALAASISGPVTIRIGRGVWASEKAAHAEDVMASAFSAKNSSSIDFECIGASLPFSAGRASAKALIGARSTASNLLTSGFVDMREETLDLRGRVKPKAGTVGLAAIAGDIQIAGKLRAPHASLDPVSTPGAIARGAAAIVTLGLSAAGTAAAHAESARKDDPCEVVFR